MATLLADIVSALPDPAILVTGADRVLCVNEPARRLVPGLAEGEPLFRALRAPEVLDTIRTARAGTPVTATWRDRLPTGRQFDIHAAPLQSDPPGTVLVMLRDRTEARRIEQLRTDFVANASHELRTPLATLLGFLETLQGPARDDPAARDRFLAIMAEQARRMSRLIDDLLSLSRIERTLHVPPADTVDLSSVAQQICDALAPVAAETGASLQLVAPEAVMVLGDRDELLRLAENLIENAIKHGGPGRVTVAISHADGSGSLRVEDEGPGVAPEDIPRLTERFYRVDNASSRAKGGTGLGLAIVKHIVARHRGRLHIEPRPERGLGITILLPLTAPSVTPNGG